MSSGGRRRATNCLGASRSAANYFVFLVLHVHLHYAARVDAARVIKKRISSLSAGGLGYGRRSGIDSAHGELADGRDLRSDVSSFLNKTSALQATERGGSFVDPLFAGSVVAGIFAVVSSIARVASGWYMNNQLKKFETKRKAGLHSEVHRTCHVLTATYNDMLFQHHGILVLLEALMGQEMFDGLVVSANVEQKAGDIEMGSMGSNLKEAWSTWRELLYGLELQLLTLFHSFGDSQVCDQRVERPNLRILLRRASSLRLPDGETSATSMLIVSSWEAATKETEHDDTGANAAQEMPATVQFVERLTTYLEDGPSEGLLRSGYMWLKEKDRLQKHWCCLRVVAGELKLSTSLGHSFDDLSEINLENVSGIQHAGSIGNRPCMRFDGGFFNEVMCVANARRLDEWMGSLRYHLCANAAMKLKRIRGCERMESALHKGRQHEEWKEMQPIQLPKAWMDLPWRQRALDANVALNCDQGRCKVSRVTPIPWRKSGVLLWRRSSSNKPQSFFFLLYQDRLSWYECVSCKNVKGHIIIRNVMIDRVDLDGIFGKDGACFRVLASAGEQNELFCAHTKQEAVAWVEELHFAYAQAFQMPLNLQRRVEVGMPTRSGELYECQDRVWALRNITITRDRLLVRSRDSILEQLLFSYISPNSFEENFHIREVAGCPKKMPRDQDPTGNVALYSKCFSFKVKGLLPRSQYVFCGLLHLDADTQQKWGDAVKAGLRIFGNDASAQPPHRERDVAWGTKLPRNLFGSQRVMQLLDTLLEKLPEAQESGVAVLCPPSCDCPKFSVPVALEDIAVEPNGFVEFILRTCGENGPAYIRSIQYRLWPLGPTAVEFRFRGFTNLSSYDTLGSNSPAPSRKASVEGLQASTPGSKGGGPPVGHSINLVGHVKATEVEERHRHLLTPDGAQGKVCGALELADVLRFLWRFVYKRDGTLLSERLAELHHQNGKALALLVLEPLIAQYHRDVAEQLPGYLWGFEQVRCPESRDCTDDGIVEAFSLCGGALIRQTFSMVEEDQLILLDFFGGKNAQTEEARNSFFHQHPMDSSLAMLVASEFWSSTNEHGCALEELWHPLEKACYAFCQRVRRNLFGLECFAKRQRFPGRKDCGVPDQAGGVLGKPVLPSTGKCQTVCRVLLPGHPGCELRDPSGLPEAVEDFYRSTSLNGLQVTKLAVWDLPRAVMPGALMFVGLPSTVLASLKLSYPAMLVDKILGISSATSTIATGFTSLASQLFAVGSGVLSTVYFLGNVYGMLATHKEFKNSKRHIGAMFDEKLRELRYLRCKVFNKLSYMHSMMVGFDERGKTMQDRLRVDFDKSPKELKNFVASLPKLPRKLCKGPAPGVVLETCEKAIRDMISKVTARPDAGLKFDTETLHRVFGAVPGQASPATSMLLSKEITTCKEEFPSVTHVKSAVPLSSLDAFWHETLPKEDAVNSLQKRLRALRKHLNLNFETLHKQGDPLEIDAKMGTTKQLKTLLMSVRDPASPPLMELEVHHVKRPAQWSSRAERSKPGRREYDLGVISAIEGQRPVGLVPAETCKRQKNEERCAKFSHRFKDGAVYEDTIRAGGFVDLNMACDAHFTDGLEESKFGGGKTEIFLATRSGYTLPPIVEVRLSDQFFDKGLSAKGFVRVQRDMNKECAMSMFRSQSFLYYRRQWTVRPSWLQTMQSAELAAKQGRQCEKDGTALRVPRPSSMLKVEKCVVCKCSATPCITFGMLETSESLGSVQDEALKRRRSVYLGEIFVEQSPLEREITNASEHTFSCIASGDGSLWSVTESLIDPNAKHTSSDNLVKNPFFNDTQVEPIPEWSHLGVVADSDSLGDESVERKSPTEPNPEQWVLDPQANDFYYRGSVHIFGDAELYEQRHDVPAKTIHDLMCGEWQELESKLRKGRKKSLDLLAQAFLSCVEGELSGLNFSFAQACNTAVENCFVDVPIRAQDFPSLFNGHACGSQGDTAVRRVMDAAEGRTARAIWNTSSAFWQFRKARTPWKGLFAPRKLVLNELSLVATSLTNGKVENFILAGSALSPSLEMRSHRSKPLGCFRITARSTKTDPVSGSKEGTGSPAVFCGPIEEAEIWQQLIANAIVDVTVGLAPTPLDWIRGARGLKCGDPQLLGDRAPQFQQRVLPDGFGILQRLSGSSELRWQEELSGQFARGVHVGIGETRSDNGVTAIGRFKHDMLSFGITTLRQDLAAATVEFVGADKVVAPNSLFEHKIAMFSGYLLETSDGLRWPAHLGTLRLKQEEPLYRGQFALWLPWGLGIWCDHKEKTMFRGVLKREYESFDVISGLVNSARYVPLLAGELVRLERDRPIADDEVLQLNVDRLPEALKHTKRLLFGSAQAVAENGTRLQGEPDIVCKSKSLFHWDAWLTSVRDLADVWMAISIGSGFGHAVTVTAQDSDPFNPGRDMDQVLTEHVDSVKNLRAHLNQLSRRSVEIADRRLKKSVLVLASAVKLGKEYNQWDLHWRRHVRDEPELLDVAQRLHKLGPQTYMRFESVSSMVAAADNALDIATATYCTLCFSPRTEVLKAQTTPAELTVKIEKARGLDATGKFLLEVSMINEGAVDAVHHTELAKVKRGRVQWESNMFRFTGWQHRLDASTLLKLALRKIDKDGTYGPDAIWTQWTIAMIGSRGDFEWKKLQYEHKNGTQHDDAPEIRIALQLTNVASVLGLGVKPLMSPGCGSSFAVKRLIDNNNVRLQRVETELKLIDRDVVEMGRRVKEKNFEQTSQALKIREELAPSLAHDPPRAEVEGTLHDDVFGQTPNGTSTGGIYTRDGPSVTMFTDIDSDDFFTGPSFFERYIKLSNPAATASFLADMK